MTTPPRTPTMREALERMIYRYQLIDDGQLGRIARDALLPTEGRCGLSSREAENIQAARAALAAEESGWQPTHQHYKGGLYRVIGDAQHSEDGSKLIVYQGIDRRIWVRPRAMFHERLADGQLRFSPLPPAPAAKEPR